MKIALGADSAGYAMKKKIIKHLNERGFEAVDCGAYDDSLSHYPEFAYKVATAVSKKEVDFGILVCGTGIGMSIAANKIKGVRASVCSEHFSARSTRLHNNANVLCLGARVIGEGLAIELVDLFLDTEPEDGRHALRVGMISDIEKGTYKV